LSPPAGLSADKADEAGIPRITTHFLNLRNGSNLGIGTYSLLLVKNSSMEKTMAFGLPRRFDQYRPETRPVRLEEDLSERERRTAANYLGGQRDFLTKHLLCEDGSAMLTRLREEIAARRQIPEHFESPEGFAMQVYGIANELVVSDPANELEYDPDRVFEEGGVCGQSVAAAEAAAHVLYGEVKPEFEGSTRVLVCRIRKTGLQLRRGWHAVLVVKGQREGQEEPDEYVLDAINHVRGPLRAWMQGEGYQDHDFMIDSIVAESEEALMIDQPLFPGSEE